MKKREREIERENGRVEENEQGMLITPRFIWLRLTEC